MASTTPSKVRRSCVHQTYACVLSYASMCSVVVVRGAGVVSPVEVHIKVHKAKRDLWGMCHAALTQHYALTNVR